MGVVGKLTQSGYTYLQMSVQVESASDSVQADTARSHQYFMIPPIALLTAIYWPLLGRREYIKIGWLALMVCDVMIANCTD
jgi:hypothetical protein